MFMAILPKIPIFRPQFDGAIGGEHLFACVRREHRRIRAGSRGFAANPRRTGEQCSPIRGEHWQMFANVRRELMFAEVRQCVRGEQRSPRADICSPQANNCRQSSRRIMFAANIIRRGRDIGARPANMSVGSYLFHFRAKHERAEGE